MLQMDIASFGDMRMLHRTTGFMLYNSGGIHFNGLSFDDNKSGKDSFQAQNVCLLARYGNQGEYGSKGWPRANSRGILGALQGPHYFGNCKKGSDCEKCSNSKLMAPGQDFGDYSIGNKCKGDKDLDNVWIGVKCYYESLVSSRCCNDVLICPC